MRRFRRTGVALVAASLAVAAVSFGWVPGASADSTSGTPAFVAGTASSAAQAITLAPSTGGLGYSITLAQSVADYQDTEGQAQAQTLDLGVIGVALTTDGCDGSPPKVPANDLPQPVSVESNDGNQTRTSSVSQGSTGATYGVEKASATTTPAGDATTTLAGLVVPGVFDIGGGVATAHAALVGQKTREAIGTASIGSVTLPGGVTLEHLTWNATQRTGAGAVQSGTFTVGSIQVGPASIPVSPETIDQAFAVVNQALAQTGFHVTPPVFVKNPDGSIAETPMSIGIDSSALGQQVVGPLLGAAQPLRAALATALLGITCQAATPLLLSDIAIGPLAGGGNLDIELGGATASSKATSFTNPFGPSGAGLSANPAGLAPNASGAATPAAGESSPLPGGSLQASGPPAATTGGSGPTGTPAVARSVSCRTTSPFGHPSCSRGAALPVALAGLALVAGLGVADWRRGRPELEESP